MYRFFYPIHLDIRCANQEKDSSLLHALCGLGMQRAEHVHRRAPGEVRACRRRADPLVGVLSTPRPTPHAQAYNVAVALAVSISLSR